MKYKISKGSVQETLLIPLYGHKLAMDLYPDLFVDRDCQELLDKIDFEAPKMSGIKAKIGAIMAATRQFDMAEVCRRYLKEHPNAAVVNLGCGLDTTFSQVDNGKAMGYHLDFPDVIRISNELLPPREREYNIPCDLNDTAWFERIDFTQEDDATFTTDIKDALVRMMPEPTVVRDFAGGHLAMMLDTDGFMQIMDSFMERQGL